MMGGASEGAIPAPKGSRRIFINAILDDGEGEGEREAELDDKNSPYANPNGNPNHNPSHGRVGGASNSINKNKMKLKATVFPSNSVTTSKYSLLTFLPKNLFEQFHGLANFYFLGIVLLQVFPQFSQVNIIIPLLPVVIIVVATGIKDAIEDWRRHVSDAQVNEAPVYILEDWCNVNVPGGATSKSTSRKTSSSLLTSSSNLLLITTSVLEQESPSRTTSKIWRWISSVWKGNGSPLNSKLFPPRLIMQDILTNKQISSVEVDGDEFFTIPPVLGGGIEGRLSSRKKSTASFVNNKRESTTSVHQNGRASFANIPGMGGRLSYTTREGIGSSLSKIPSTTTFQDSSTFALSTWKTLKVGDIILLRNNDAIPADIIILGTGEGEDTAYVETKNLDGETNLKIKKGPFGGGGGGNAREGRMTPAAWKAVHGFVDAEAASTNLYTFSGSLVVKGDGGEGRKKSTTVRTKSGHSVIPIGPTGLLLRGCMLRNTSWVLGMVVYTGIDTKILLNSGATPSKRSNVDRQINPKVMLNVFILILLSSLCAIVDALYSYTFAFEKASYISIAGSFNSPYYDMFLVFFNSLIVFQNIIPIALYISLEVAKTVQSYLIYSDIDMYDEATNLFCLPKSWNLCDDLGQIEYIFSDKTGTLTSNIMDFKKASIGGIDYGMWGGTGEAALIELERERERMARKFEELFKTKYMDDDMGFVDSRIPNSLIEGGSQAAIIKEFFLLLAVCHTVLVEKPDENDPDVIAYRAQSPDEAALVTAAKNVGYVCLNRTENKIELDIMGTSKTFTVLNIMEFNSDRKRMSVIVKRPEGDIVLFCKGADSVIYERLDLERSKDLMTITSTHLQTFANDGLRTLCLGYRNLSSDEYHAWSKEYNEAKASIENRDAKCDAVAEKIERNLILMGATAIEDKLQDGVPEAIALLAKAGIKLWVLTGDKVETAINIGFSCNLLTKSMVLIVIQSTSALETLKQLREALAQFWNEDGSVKEGGESDEFALVIDGASLKFGLQGACKFLLLELGCRCKAVLCCRVSPLQKALVVKMVREGLGAMCLAIGDGANDVSMIQEADIGIGISGKEGLQAVMASDYAISQFRFLSKLLLVHGRWAYIRSAELVLNYFYKNITWLLILFWHQFYCGFTAEVVLDFTYCMFFNTLFTILPTVMIGMFDQDVTAQVSLATPQLYLTGIRQEVFNNERLWIYIGHGIWQSLITYFGVYLFVSDNFFGVGGHDYDASSFSTLMGFSTIFVINTFGTCNWYTWTWITVAAYTISLVLWVVYVLIYDSTSGSPTNGSLTTIFCSASFYAIIVVSSVLSLIPRLAIKYTQQMVFPTDTDLIQEAQHMNSKGKITVEDDQVMEGGMESPQPLLGSTSASDPSTQNPNLHSPRKPSIIITSSGGEGSVTRRTVGFNQQPSSPTSTSSSTTPSFSTVLQEGFASLARSFGTSQPPLTSRGGSNKRDDLRSRTSRSGSIVYMQTKDRMGIPNTGFAFSQGRGMEELIVTSETNFPDTQKEEPERGSYPNSRFRNFSNTFQSMMRGGGGRPPSTSIGKENHEGLTSRMGGGGGRGRKKGGGGNAVDIQDIYEGETEVVPVSHGKSSSSKHSKASTSPSSTSIHDMPPQTSKDNAAVVGGSPSVLLPDLSSASLVAGKSNRPSPPSHRPAPTPTPTPIPIPLHVSEPSVAGIPHPPHSTSSAFSLEPLSSIGGGGSRQVSSSRLPPIPSSFARLPSSTTALPPPPPISLDTADNMRSGHWDHELAEEEEEDGGDKSW